MSRPLKFRAWDHQSKKMLEPEDISLSWLPNGALLVNGDDRIGQEEFNSFEIVEFTGLHDSKGNEIWEGDILELLDSDFPSPKNRVDVSWNTESTGFDPFLDHECGHLINVVGERPDRCVVIGNIFENQGMME